MRRKSLLLCLMFMSILGMTAHSNVDNTVPHRKVYGFFLRGNSLGGYGFGDLYLDNLQACSLTYPYSNPLAYMPGLVPMESIMPVSIPIILMGRPLPAILSPTILPREKRKSLENMPPTTTNSESRI